MSGPGGLVERAGRQAGRDRHPLEHAGADVRHALRDRLLVDVDAVAVAGGERPGVARRLREPDQQQRERGDADRRDVILTELERRAARRRQAARDVADERDAVSAEVERRRRRAARRRRARARREPPARRSAAPRISASATSPTSSVVQWIVAERPEPRRRARATRSSPSDDVPVSFGQLADRRHRSRPRRGTR